MRKRIFSVFLFVLLFGFGWIRVQATQILPVQDHYAYVENGKDYLYWEQTDPFSFSYLNKTFALATATAESSLPESYDAREYGLQTDVYSQGGTSACWAIAAIDAVEHNFLLRQQEAVKFSPAHLVWFAHRSLVYSSGRDAGDGTNVQNPYTHGGNWVDAAVTLARWSGPALQAVFPFNGSQISAMGNYTEQDRYAHSAVLTDASCYYAKQTNEKTQLSATVMQQIKAAILRDGAVQTSFYSDVSYYNDGADGTSYYQETSYLTNHAVLIVGWDDAYAASNFREDCRPDENGAWLCKNTWSANWGDEGYFWLSYKDASLNQIVSYAAVSASLYEDNYQYDGFGFHGRLRSDDYIQYVNVFTADADCEIAAVATWFLQDNTNYTVRIYKSPDADIPVSTYCAAAVRGVQQYYGYHVIPLQAPIYVRSGETFSVAVELQSSAVCPQVYAPIENANASDYVSYSRPGQSFVQIERDGAWYDTSAEGLNNVCIKAFTAHTHSDGDANMLCDACGTEMNQNAWFFYRRLLALFWAIFANLDVLL